MRMNEIQKDIEMAKAFYGRTPSREYQCESSGGFPEWIREKILMIEKNNDAVVASQRGFRACSE